MSPLTAITDYLLSQSAHIILLFAVVASVCFALRKKTAHLRYLLWLIIIAKCLVPSLLTISLAILPSDPAPAVPIMIEAPLDMAPVLNAPQRTIYAAPVAAPTLFERLAQVPPKMWFMYLWIAGVIIYAIVVIAKAVHLNSYLVKNRKSISEGLQHEFDAILDNLPTCYMVKGIAQPFVWGLVKGSIYLPANFIRSTSPAHRKQIISHEAGHVNRYDPLVNLLQIIAQTVFFFHPLVWIANRVIRAEREKCCDEIAIAKLNATPRDYGSAIVETLVKEYESTIPIPSMAIAGPIKNIEDRIKTIMKPNKKFYKRPTVIALISILLVAAFAIPTSFALTAKETDTIIAQSDNLTVLDMDIKPIQQGKNEVYITIHNDANIDQVFGCHLYSRSVDYGSLGIGWGTIFFETIKASTTKECRFVYKIQGPVTENTWLTFTYYNPATKKAYLDKGDRKEFYKVRFDAKDLEIASDKANLSSASKAQYRQASQILRRMKSYIKKKEYDRAWNIFTEDYKNAEYQVGGIEKFKKSMEPTYPLEAAFHWDKSQFLKLKPKSAAVRDGKVVLTAFYGDQPWSIDFVKDGRELKIDWIGGYRPAILDIREEDAKEDAKRVRGFVEDFFKHNYRDVTAKKTIEWSEPVYHDNENVSIRYKYEATIWDKDKKIIHDEFTFDKDGKFVSVKKIRRGEVGSTKWLQELVEHFFNNNYRDITARKTIEWGDAVANEDGTFSIRYKYEATIWDKDKLIQNKIFTFDKDEKYISAKKIEEDKQVQYDAPVGDIEGMRSYKVDRSVAEFADGDFSTPQAAYAQINRVYASGKAAGWVRVGRAKFAGSLSRMKDQTTKPKYAEELRNAQILEVVAYGNGDDAIVFSRIGDDLIDARHVVLEEGMWLNAGHDQYNKSFEDARERKLGKISKNQAKAKKADEKIVAAMKDPKQVSRAAMRLFRKIKDADYEKILSYYNKKTGQWKRGAPRDPVSGFYTVYTNRSGFKLWLCENLKNNPIESITLGKVFTGQKETKGRPGLPTVEYQLVLKDGKALRGQLAFSYSERNGKGYWHCDEGIDWHLMDDPFSEPLGYNEFKNVDNRLHVTNKKAITIKSRFLLVSQKLLDDLKLDLPEKNSQNTEFLDDDKVKSLMKATRVYANSKVLSAPTVVVSDGESAMVTIVSETAYISGYEKSDGDEPAPIIETAENATRMEVLPKITEKGHVFMELDIEIKEITDIQETLNEDGLPINNICLTTTSIVSQVTVPDGGTVMYDGGMVEAEQEDGNVEKRRLLILVKPSIEKP